MTEEPIGVRVQRMPMADQALVLASIAATRSESGMFTGQAVATLFYETGLPPPTKVANVLATLRNRGHATPGKAHGAWSVTPLGRQRTSELVGDQASELLIEALPAGADLAHSRHPLIPSTLAPPQLLGPVSRFTAQSPSSLHVFGMTRFPDEGEERPSDPVTQALEVTADAVEAHGLKFLLASQRALVDDLWGNVAAHMWASNYGIALFEDRRGRGMNYNLVIEVGSMLMTGRRCLLLKDSSIDRMPTDLVGFIYKSIDLDNPATVSAAVHEWSREDLALGRCESCRT